MNNFVPAPAKALRVASLPLLLLFGGCGHFGGTMGIFAVTKGCTMYGSAAEIEMAESLGRKWTFDATTCQIILEPVAGESDEGSNSDAEGQPEGTGDGSDSLDYIYSDVVRRVREEADGGR